MLQNRTFRTVLLFLTFGITSELCLWQMKESAFFLSMTAPILAAAQLLESHFSIATTLSPLQNEFSLILPLTILYFGSVGYWLCQICREEGFPKYLILFSFVTFLALIHWQALGYLDSLLFGR